MHPIAPDDLAAAVSGRWVGTPVPVLSVCTDSREISPGCLFVALKGDTFDGHDFLPRAGAGGAAAALVDRPCDCPVPRLVVDDARRAMGRLATLVRRRLRGVVIAVAGSNGKTGTKHLIHAALSARLRGSMSPKSFNNDVGVPVTIFAADPADDYVVIETGTNHPGEVGHLSRMAEPDIAVVTSIGAEHLEFFGDLAGVAAENADVAAGLRPGGLLLVNGDADVPLPGSVRRRTTFGFAGTNDLVIRDVATAADGTRFRVGFDPEWFHVPQPGRHVASNALTAVAVARHLGLTDDEIRSGLARASGPEMRLQLVRAGPVTILNDAYNANPSSMRAGLETLRDLATGRRVAVLGDMREMGAAAAAGHTEVGRVAKECGVDLLVCVGPLSAGVAEAAGIPGTVRVSTTADAAAVVPSLLRAGDWVLVKASRGMKLEAVVTAIVGAAGRA